MAKKVRKTKEPTAMLFVGNNPTISAASAAIREVLAVKVNDSVAVEALKTLAEIARAPSNVNINGCSFQNK